MGFVFGAVIDAGIDVVFGVSKLVVEREAACAAEKGVYLNSLTKQARDLRTSSLGALQVY